MKTSWSALGFIAVAAGIGLLEWKAARQPGHNELIITQGQQSFVREQVLKAGEQAGNTSDTEQAMKAYMDEEILYREGLKLGLDKDDLIVKRRVVQKMRFLLEDMTPLQSPNSEQLQTWLSQNPERYQTGETIRFSHYFFSRGKRGDDAVLDAKQALQQLKQGQTISADPSALQAENQGMDTLQMTREIGQLPAKHLFALPVGEWSEPVPSALGFHLFKVIEKTPGRLMTLEEAGAQLNADLVAAQREALNEAAMAALRSTYTITVQP